MTAHPGHAVGIAGTQANTASRWRLALVGALTLAALVWSSYLATVSLGWVKLGLCSTGSCSELVLSSSWARWMGVPVSILAMGFYLALLCVLPLTASEDVPRRRAAWSVLVAMAFTIVGAAAWFVGLMAGHLHKSCGHCASMHLLGAVIAFFLITMAPMGREPAALRPRRMLVLAAIGFAAVVLLAGGQLLAQIVAPLPAEAPAGQAIPSTQAEPAKTQQIHDAPAAPAPQPPQPSPAVATDTPSKQEPDPNTPQGKAALVAELKLMFGDKWDKPTTPCQLIRYFLSQPAVHATASTVYYEVLQQGAGPLPKPEDSVRIHFQGKLWSGEVFKDTVVSGQPQDVRVADMIPGVAEALTMMPVGSRWRLLLAPHLAYGSTGLPGMVPPDTTVFCEVQLLNILPAAAATGDGLTPPQQETHE